MPSDPRTHRITIRIDQATRDRLQALARDLSAAPTRNDLAPILSEVTLSTAARLAIAWGLRALDRALEQRPQDNAPKRPPRKRS